VIPLCSVAADNAHLVEVPLTQAHVRFRVSHYTDIAIVKVPEGDVDRAAAALKRFGKFPGHQMQYKPIPRLDYHHVQPRTIRPPHHHPGDLNDRRVLAARRLPWWDPDHDRLRRRLTLSFWFGGWL
jgi:hypothetical protein